MMTSPEPWFLPHHVGQQPQASDTHPAGTSSGWFQNLHMQSVPAESLRTNREGNDWLAARAATEHPAEGKEWRPRTPPHLVVSIIGELLKLLPDAPQPNASSAGDIGAHKRETSNGSFVMPFSAPVPAQEPPASLPNPNHNRAILPTPPPPYARGSAISKRVDAEGSALRPLFTFPAAGTSATLRICYAEYPSIFIVQTKEFQPYVQVRRSSQPAVHIYGRFPLRIDDQFDAGSKQHDFHSFEPLPGEPLRNEEAEEEGLINPYIRQKQPTVFFHFADQSPSSFASGGDGQPWQPRICIDTTSLWWPSIQCTFANPSSSRLTAGVNAWGHTFAQEIACGISLSGPMKPLSMDLPY